ncbi:hypothetical protein DFJ73DRAFT_824090 [Zopfochytrium polystomum]|nr:hypothetical protein DFJ73DRAFT_824090 [Zopfochytrium polystomum]
MMGAREKSPAPKALTLLRSKSDATDSTYSGTGSSTSSLDEVASPVATSEELVSAGLALDPADVLTDRARGWRSLINTLYSHFDSIADAEKALAKSYRNVATEWNTPSGARDLAFGEKSAIRSVTRLLHDESDRLASQHQAISHSLASQTVASLAAIKKEVKKKLDALEDEQKRRNKERLKDRDAMQKAKENLQKALSFARKNGADHNRYGDPWLANLEVKRKLAIAKAKHEARTVALVDVKRDFSIFESNVIREVRQALNGVASLKEIQEHRSFLAGEIKKTLDALEADKEWKLFCDARLDATGGPAMFEDNDYEGAKDELVQVRKEGSLQRRGKGLVKSYKEYYYFLTAAGYLHEFKQRPSLVRDEKVDPDDSIFMGDCTLEPYKAEDRKPEEFILTEKNEQGKMFQRSSKTFKFLGASMSETKEWHEAISVAAKTTLGVVATGTSSTLGRSSTKVNSVSETVETVTRTVTVEVKKTDS